MRRNTCLPSFSFDDLRIVICDSFSFETLFFADDGSPLTERRFGLLIAAIIEQLFIFGRNSLLLDGLHLWSLEIYSDRTALFKEVLKDYELDAERDRLGEGAFGEVYRMTQKTTGEAFALKVMKLIDKRGQSLGRFEIFKNEVFSLRKNPHKNIIKLIDHFVVQKVFLCFMVMVMEFANEGDLHQRLKQRMDLPKKRPKHISFKSQTQWISFIRTA